VWAQFFFSKCSFSCLGHGALLEAEGNVFKNKNDTYDQTLIPLDYEESGHIRDFSLFTHFVQPMAAGVTVTCVMVSFPLHT